MDTASCGYAPYERLLEFDGISKQERKEAWEELKSLRDTGTISREEFKKRKADIFR